MILDSSGAPLRRRIGFLREWNREQGGRMVDLVSAVSFSAVETDTEGEEAEAENS